MHNDPERDINPPEEDEHVEATFEVLNVMANDYNPEINVRLEVYTDGQEWIQEDAEYKISRILKAHDAMYSEKLVELKKEAIANLKEHLFKEVGLMRGVSINEIEDGE